MSQAAGPRPTPQLDLPLLTLRALFFASAAGLGLYLARLAESPQLQFSSMVVAMLLALAIISVDAFAISRSSVATVSAIAFGLVLGFIAAQLFIGIISLMGDFEDSVGKDQLNGIRLALTLIFCYLGPSYLLRTKDDFRFIVPYVEFQRQGRGPIPLVLDTSAIIDGRIVDLAQARLFDAPFLVPRYVLEELQHIADSHDKNRRGRGRRGLDQLKTLQAVSGVEVEFPRGAYADSEVEVDRRLIELTKARGAKLVTVDLNLQKVCEVERVPVLNLNQVAQAMRARFIPGDTLSVKIVKPGEGAAQGVGYLEDGTMVVVEGARRLKGKQVSAVVTSSIQSSAGRMVFARHTPGEPRAEQAGEPEPEPEPVPAGGKGKA